MPDTDRIAKRAHQIWDQEGRPADKAEQHWLRAEQELATIERSKNPAYTKVEELSKQAYTAPERPDVPVSEHKKQLLEAEAEMRQREKPQALPASKSPPPEDPIEPVQDGLPAKGSG